MARFVHRGVTALVTLTTLLLPGFGTLGQDTQSAASLERPNLFVALEVYLDGAEPATIAVQEENVATYVDYRVGESFGIITRVTDPLGGDVDVSLVEVSFDENRVPNVGAALDQTAGKINFSSTLSLPSAPVEVRVIDIASSVDDLSKGYARPPNVSVVGDSRDRCGVACAATRVHALTVSMRCGSCSSTGS